MVVSDVVLNPLERLVDERERAIARLMSQRRRLLQARVCDGRLRHARCSSMSCRRGLDGSLHVVLSNRRGE